MSYLSHSPRAYRESAVLTASREQLVVLLYDGALRFLHQAAVAMQTKDIQSSRRFERMVNGIPVKRIGKPVDVANTALFLASEEGAYFSGSILHPDGGIIMQ